MSEIFLENSKSSYIVGGQTFAPGSPITLGGESSVVTYRMLTSSSQTFIAVGTTTTVPLDDKASSSPISAFIEASRGNFVLHGTTLQSGESVTIGSRSLKSTLRMTTGRDPPELVVDASVTIPLERLLLAIILLYLPKPVFQPSYVHRHRETLYPHLRL